MADTDPVAKGESLKLVIGPVPLSVDVGGN
jgi:hypothetical protein